jgi:hypothetical protein
MKHAGLHRIHRTIHDPGDLTISHFVEVGEINDGAVVRRQRRHALAEQPDVRRFIEGSSKLSIYPTSAKLVIRSLQRQARSRSVPGWNLPGMGIECACGP